MSTATNVFSARKLASKIAGAPSSISFRVSLTRSSTAWCERSTSTAGKPVSCQRADVCALVKPVLQDLVRLELDGEGLVDFPPEELVALEAGGVAGFRETHLRPQRTC